MPLTTKTQNQEQKTPGPKPWYKRWWGILLLLFLLLIGLSFLGLVLLIYAVSTTDSLNNAATSTSTNRAHINIQDNPWTGSPEADLVIVEFADYTCQYSRQAFTVIRRLARQRNDVKFVFKDLPIVSDLSLPLAMAGRCAGDQGMFWQMHDRLFLAGRIDSRSKIYEIAERTGVNMTQFRQCMEEQEFLPEIRSDVKEADRLGVTGTPTWFINGYKVEGNAPYATFNQILDRIKNKQ